MSALFFIKQSYGNTGSIWTAAQRLPAFIWHHLQLSEFPEVTDVPEIIYGSWLRVKDSWFCGDRDYRADVRCKREEV